MKRVFSLLLCCLLLLGLTACDTPQGAEDHTTDPPPKVDYVYDMTTYEHFAWIFDENPDIPWEEQGKYTLGLTGLGTDVTVKMDGLTTVAITAFGRTQEVNLTPFQGEVNAAIEACDGAVVIRDCEDYSCSSWILTKDAVFAYAPKGDISTSVRVDDNGVLCYRTFWGEYDTSFNQWDTAPLDLCTDRAHFLEERGTITLVNGQATFTKQSTKVLSDEYDVDALFAEAKRDGMYEAYDTVDELFAANKNKAE